MDLDKCNAPSAFLGGGLDPRIPRDVRDVEAKSGKAIRPFHLIMAVGALVAGLLIGTLIRQHLTQEIQLRLLIMFSILGFGLVVTDVWLRKHVWKE